MPVIRSFDEARRLLRPFYEAYSQMDTESIYTLDRIKALLKHIGDPQDSLKVIHVAGTSGKSSTAYYLAALLGATGAKVGLSVSPAIDEMNERVQIDLTPLAEVEYCSVLGEFMDVAAASHIDLSYFELKVAFMFHEFARRGVDYAVVEVGMGGLLDATNVVIRGDKVCVITDIGFDHTRILGNTLAEIAAQKAGIIQAHNTVFMYRQGSEVMAAVQAACQHAQARLHEIEPADAKQLDLQLVKFQQRNFYLAQQASGYVLDRDDRPPLTTVQIRGAATVRIPGRMEVLRLGAKTLVLDGAHNEQKMTAFVRSLLARYPDQPIAVLLAFARAGNNRWQPTVDALIPAVHHIIVTSFDLRPDDRLKISLEASEVADYLKQQGFLAFNVEADLGKATRQLLKRPEPILVATGSLYMLGPVRQALV